MTRKLVITWGLLLLLLVSTSPSRMPLIFLFIPFVLLYLAVFFTVSVVVPMMAPKGKFAPRHVNAVAMIAGFAVVTVFSLNSIGQLSSKDIIVAGLAVLLGYFYLQRTRS